jgi:hypothetical protein
LNIKSRFDGDKVDVSHERAYAHCISHQWVLEYVVRGKESRIGNSIRDFINNKTVLGIFLLGASIWPTTAILVLFFYRSFAFLGVSITVFIIAAFLIRASDNVKASSELLSWLKTQDDSELKKNDVPVAIISHGLAIIVVLYLIPLAIALLYLLFGAVNKISTNLKGELLRNL